MPLSPTISARPLTTPRRFEAFGQGAPNPQICCVSSFTTTPVIDRQAIAFISPVIGLLARALVRSGVGANAISFVGLAVGWCAAAAIAGQWFGVGATLILASRLCDGLDGAVARLTQATDRGGFLDISLDFLFYPAIPLAFAWADPARNALAAAVLLAAFVATGTGFLVIPWKPRKNSFSIASLLAPEFRPSGDYGAADRR